MTTRHQETLEIEPPLASCGHCRFTTALTGTFSVEKGQLVFRAAPDPQPWRGPDLDSCCESSPVVSFEFIEAGGQKLTARQIAALRATAEAARMRAAEVAGRWEAVSPLSARCPSCGVPAGDPCLTRYGRPARLPHLPRTDAAVVLAAHSDPALDEHFARRGQCGVCGCPGLDARHRTVDAIAGMLAAEEKPDVVADEHGVSEAAVGAVSQWMARWPGAWR